MVVESDTVHFFVSETDNAEKFLAKQHLAFEVESIAYVTNVLNNMGVTDYAMGEVTLFSHGNYKWCEWRGPSGIRLECVERISEK